MTTDLYFLLDASGSMHGREQEVVDHFNEYLARHRTMPEETYLSLATFEGDNFTWVFLWKAIALVSPLTLSDYVTGGVTPLNDSLAKVLDAASRNPDTGKLVIVISDGFENASVDYPGVGNAALKARIEALDKKQWGIVYLGEGMSEKQGRAVADSLSVGASNAAPVQGMKAAFAAADFASRSYFDNRTGGRDQTNLVQPHPDA